MQSNDIQKDITIRELAAMLDVSPATISRALNNDGTVAQKTRKKVFELAERVGYRTNQYAKLLRNGRSNTIGCIVPRLDNYLTSSMISGVEKAARREDYSLLVMQSQGCVGIETENANFLFNKRVDGLIVLAAEGAGDPGHLLPFLKKNIPVILLTRPASDQRFINVYVDDHRAGYEMTRYLLGQGRRRIMHLTTNLTKEGHDLCCQGYKLALEEAGVPFRDYYIVRGGAGIEDGVEAAETICRWKERPDAIFAVSDHCAAGCLKALLKKGIYVPGEIAIAGFNNDPVSLATDPQLTTMRYPGQELGESAVNHLVHLMHGSTAIGMVDTIVLRSDLIVRGSTESVGY